MALLDQAVAVAAAPRANKRAKVAAEEEEYDEPCRSPPAPAAKKKVARLTVWCKSLVFHGEGYAVFDDADGRMVFRVDSYGAGRRRVALMDHAGRVLLTVVRRHRRHCRVLLMSLTPETWEVYKGDVGDGDGAATCSQDEPPRLVMRATKDLGNPSCTVSMLAAGAGAGNGDEAACGHGVYRMSWSRREEWSRIKYYSNSAQNDAPNRYRGEKEERRAEQDDAAGEGRVVTDGAARDGPGRRHGHAHDLQLLPLTDRLTG
uniref:Uncharacterized protein n=1 Tax=Oryza glumipatula TaxID=40148 RepID=A0A0D9ZUE4_9ORYZ